MSILDCCQNLLASQQANLKVLWESDRFNYLHCDILKKVCEMDPSFESLRKERRLSKERELAQLDRLRSQFGDMLSLEQLDAEFLRSMDDVKFLFWRIACVWATSFVHSIESDPALFNPLVREVYEDEPGALECEEEHQSLLAEALLDSDAPADPGPGDLVPPEDPVKWSFYVMYVGKYIFQNMMGFKLYDF